MSEQPVCVVVGAGPGNGLAFAKRFAAEGYRVAVVARDAARLEALAVEAKAHAVPCDVTDPAAVAAAFEAIATRLGDPSVLVYNAGAGKFGNADSVTPADLESAWRTNALGAFCAAKAVLPGMRKRKSGRMVFIGATASLKGGANFVAFASAKAALRSLAQSLARQLGPEGIHVSHVVVDGVIDLPRTRARMPDKPDDFFLSPGDIAESVYRLTTQPKSAWTFELDLRPSGEKW